MAGKGRKTTGESSSAAKVLGWSTSGRVVKYSQAESALTGGTRRGDGRVLADKSGRASVVKRSRAPIAVEVVLVDNDSGDDATAKPDAPPEPELASAQTPLDAETARRVADAADAVTQSLELGATVRALARSLSMDATALVAALTSALRAAPVPAPAESLLSPGEAAALGRAGSLKTMPAVSGRASVATAARAAAVEASALTVREVADMLGRSEVRIRQRLSEHSLLGLRAGTAWRVPAFQFDSGAELPGWDRVMTSLPHDVHPLTVARFLERPHPDLGLDGEPTSPRQWLRAGADPRPVVDIAAELHTLP